MAGLASSDIGVLLRNPAFRRIWLVGAATGVARWLELLAVGVYTFDVTGSPFQVALMVFLRMLPLALLGAVIGAMIDRIGHQRVLGLGLGLLVAISTALAVLAAAGQVEIWHLALGAFLGGIVWSTDITARRGVLGLIAGTARAGPAMALDAATGNITRALGPAIGGVLLATIGLEGAFGLSVLLYGFSLAVLLGAELPRLEITARAQSLWRDIAEGLDFARRDRAILGTLAVTVVFNVWAFPYTSMIPVIGRDHLDLGASAVGLLMSAEGAGAFLGAMTVAFAARPGRYRHIYFIGTVVCLAMIAGFALSSNSIVSAMIVMIAGCGAGCFSSMQSTIVFLSAPPEARSRLLGLLAVCIGTGPIGFMHIGWLAERLGAPLATMISGLEGLVALLVVALVFPVLKADFSPAPGP